MDLVRLERPRDTVTGVNPDFIGKERQSLKSFVVTLGAHARGPLRLRVGGAKSEGGSKGEGEADSAQRKRCFHTRTFEKNKKKQSSTKFMDSLQRLKKSWATPANFLS